MPEPTAAAIEPERLHGWFDRALSQWPDEVAIDVPPGFHRKRAIATFAELDARARDIAARLGPLPQPESIVAIHLPRGSIDTTAAQLAVLRLGGAFVCLDPKFPDDHVRFILDDAAAVAVVTDAATRLGGLTDVAVVDLLTSAPIGEPPPEADVSPDQLAYVIYTSGTTGRPKGVMIEHRGVANLVGSDLERYGFGPGDRIAHGSSPSFDSSIEEVWPALAGGATVVVMDEETARLGPDLTPWLRDERITVVMPTPTMLRTTGVTDPVAELPDLRLVYPGGEALTRDLADLWAPVCWLENGYGPTECTVTVVRGRVHPDEEITLGTPLRGHEAFLLDPDQRIVEDGQIGELCIRGVGVARGYLGRPELTTERFPHHPELGRIYRTGDLARRESDGRLTYHGRIDTQVKVRGFRIELEAIEATLAKLPGIREAACIVQGEGPAARLVAFVVREGQAPDLHDALAERLPEFMVPARFVDVDCLPTSVSGKLDRKALQSLTAGPSEQTGATVETPLQQRVATAFQDALGSTVALDDDFFDAGGDSVRAALVISALRRHPETALLAVRDIYSERTIRRLAERAAASHAGARGRDPSDPSDRGPRDGQPIWTTCVQATWLAGAATLGSLTAYVVLFEWAPRLVDTIGLTAAALSAPLIGVALSLVWLPISIGLAAATKRLLIGRYRPGRYPAWGRFHRRHWVVRRMAGLIPWGFIRGTELHSVALRALGARIGKRVHVHDGVDLAGWDLLDLGDDVTLSQDARVGVVELSDGGYVVAPVRIESGATLEVRAGVDGDTVVEAGGTLAALASLRTGTVLPAGERWVGVPARPLERSLPKPVPAPLDPFAFTCCALGMRAGLAVLRTLPALILLLALVASGFESDAAAVEWLLAPDSALGVALLASGAVALGTILDLTLEAFLLRWTPKIPAGAFSRWSIRYVWLDLRTRILTRAGTWLSGALFWPWWLRAAGMRIGRKSEISTIIDLVPEHVSIGSETFFADGIYLAGPQITCGTVTTAHTEVGSRVFLGNHVVVPPGQRVPDDVLLGVATIAGDQVTSGTNWFGNPAFELPRREIVEADRRETHDPSAIRYVNRLIWEAARFGLPALLTAGTLAWFAGVHWIRHGSDLSASLLVSLPLVGVAIAVAFSVLLLAMKWSLLGRVRPGQHALWSCWCSRWDFLYVAWGMLARPFLAPLDSTLLLAPYLRAMGVRVGKKCVLGSGFAQVVDPDMLHLEDGATVDCSFQAHSFEDRVLKIDHVRIGRNATVRDGTVILYGANIDDDSEVLPHSVVMKNEHLPPGGRFDGAPTRAR